MKDVYWVMCLGDHLVVFFCSSISVPEDTVPLLNFWWFILCLQEEIITSSVEDSKMNLYLRKSAAGFSHVALLGQCGQTCCWLNPVRAEEANPRDQHSRSQLQPVCSDSCLSFHHIFLKKVSESYLCRQYTGVGRHIWIQCQWWDWITGCLEREN